MSGAPLRPIRLDLPASPGADLQDLAPAAGLAPRTMRLDLPAGDLGTECTIAAMRAMIHHAERLPGIRSAARAIAASQAWDQGGIAALTSWAQFGHKVYHWLAAVVDFKRDAAGLEHLRHPALFLASIKERGRAQGDCDDTAMLACALMRAAGILPVLITVARRPAPADFEHVFYGVDPNGPAYLGGAITPERVMPFDPQERTPPGTWAPGLARVQVWPV